MSLWNRAPREVYRVYGEDQYLHGGTAPTEESAPVGPTASEAGSALRQDTTLVEPDGRGEASWTAYAPDVAAGVAASHSDGPVGLHAGRLIGVGLLVGVGLATLALVLLNMGHHPRGIPSLVGQGARVQTVQRAALAPGKRAAPAQGSPPRARRAWSAPPRTSHRGVPPAPAIRPRAPQALRQPEIQLPETQPREPHTQGAAASSIPSSAELSAQEEFGFEQ